MATRSYTVGPFNTIRDVHFASGGPCVATFTTSVATFEWTTPPPCGAFSTIGTGSSWSAAVYFGNVPQATIDAVRATYGDDFTPHPDMLTYSQCYNATYEGVDTGASFSPSQLFSFVCGPATAGPLLGFDLYNGATGWAGGVALSLLGDWGIFSIGFTQPGNPGANPLEVYKFLEA